jgi:hypothetical protein
MRVAVLQLPLTGIVSNVSVFGGCRLEQNSNFPSGLRQHIHSWFRAPSGPITQLLFLPRPLTWFEKVVPLRQEEGLVFLSRFRICCIVTDVWIRVRVNCCWPSLTQSFLVPGPAGLIIFFCLKTLGVVQLCILSLDGFPYIASTRADCRVSLTSHFRLLGIMSQFIT